MKKITIEISEKPYQVLVADNEETRQRGLMGIKNMPEDKGMLFKWDQPGNRQMWMHDTLMDLLQVFLDEDMQVLKTVKRKALDDTLVGCDKAQYVLELNADQDIDDTDYIEINSKEKDKSPTMKVLASDGSTQMELNGGERIFSRKNTKIIIKQAKKAYASNSDVDYKRLGKSIFKFLKIQDNNTPEYVQAPK